MIIIIIISQHIVLGPRKRPLGLIQIKSLIFINNIIRPSSILVLSFGTAVGHSWWRVLTPVSHVFATVCWLWILSTCATIFYVLAYCRCTFQWFYWLSKIQAHCHISVDIQYVLSSFGLPNIGLMRATDLRECRKLCASTFQLLLLATVTTVQ